MRKKGKVGKTNEPTAQHTIILQDIVFASMKDTNAIQVGHSNGIKYVWKSFESLLTISNGCNCSTVYIFHKAQWFEQILSVAFFK